MAEIETEPVTTSEALTPHRGAGSLLDRWVNSDPEAAVARVESMVKMLEALRVASIRATYPADWCIHVARDQDGNIVSQTGYLQDCGAERAGKVWGIEVGSPAIEREDFPDSTYCYHMVADAFSRVTGERLDYAEGSRWSGDLFFTRRQDGPENKIDPTDVRKAAWANLHGRAVRSLSGLTQVPLEQLGKAGLDVSKVRTIDYNKGAKGGTSVGAGVGTADPVMGFGNAEGKRPADLDSKDLAWYIAAYTRNLDDPKRAKFRAANERILAALNAEAERRTQAADHNAATTTAPSETKDDAPTAIGKKRGDVNTALFDAAKGRLPVVALMLRALTKDWGTAERSSLSELTADELDRVLATPDSVLAKLAEIVSGGK